MTHIDAVGAVTTDHRLIVEAEVPADVPPGEHRVLLLIDPLIPHETSSRELNLSSYPVDVASGTMSFRREDLYDDGR